MSVCIRCEGKAFLSRMCYRCQWPLNLFAETGPMVDSCCYKMLGEACECGRYDRGCV